MLDAMHIELHRTFHELSRGNGHGSDDEPLYPSGNRLTWEDLLNEHRVIILSEAGSGKTEEIREAARRLRGQGKAAFFLRLENVATDFEIAFEEGTLRDFELWLASTDQGWLLLDSIDESRLKDPSDFERAIRRVSVRLATAKQRTHLFLTGRAPAWRPVTDRALCESLFPYFAASVPANPGQAHDQDVPLRSTEAHVTASASTFRVVSLDDLSPEQVDRFARGKGISDSKAFLDAVERADAWSFTARPQDLDELTGFWNEEGRIGTRYELMRNSIDRRLRERDQTRDEAKPLPIEMARAGARLIAAACTLTHQQSIRVPDGSSGSSGLRIETVLTDWTATEYVTLLSRPLFDEAIYGSVRFHHRSVREYLAAEWFAGLLLQETSRRSIEQLFFRTQYGIQVVVPSLRPILPWLAIFDARTLERIRRLAPEIMFEGGDPSRLPIHVRREVLEHVCDQRARGVSRRSIADFAAIQRFAATDLTDDVKALIRKHESHEDIQSFLLRMVWQGRLVGALLEAIAVATSASSGHYARMAAFRAIADLGSGQDNAKVREAFAAEAAVLDRELLSELVGHAEPTAEVLAWLFDCLGRVSEPVKYKVDHLGEQLASFVVRLNASGLALVVDRLTELLETPPVIERRHCEVSKRFRWLLQPAAAAVERMLETRDPNVLKASALSILRLLPVAGEYEALRFDHSKLQFAKLVGQWTEAKWTLFWHIVADERRWLDTKKSERLTDYWRATLWPSYISFQADDFAQAVREIEVRPLVDDKLVALSLAFRLYVENGRPLKGRLLLKDAVKSNLELNARLSELMRPPRQTDDLLQYKRKNDAWKRRAQKRRLREAKNREDWHRHLLGHVSMLRDPGFADPEAIWNGQHYLFERMREFASGSSSTWSDGNWQSLEAEFGPEVARAFRDGAVAYWRRHRPQLISEGAAHNSTPFPTIFGLAGLTIEARETAGWATSLGQAEAEAAFRYAMRELNGFPAWFAPLFAAHPNVVRTLTLCEISHELGTEDDGAGSQYLLYDISWSGDFLWDALAPDFVELLKAKSPRNTKNLRYMMDVVQSSNLPDTCLEELAALKVATVHNPLHVAQWFALWTGVSPEAAIDALERRLADIADAGECTRFAMTYVTQLLGGRRGGSKVRESFRTPLYLKRLYLLMHLHVRGDDDIDRANTGVYSPQLRDEAQDAREHLVALLSALPGKEAYLALQGISRSHPDKTRRPWFALQAKSKAESDAEGPKWTAVQVRDFNEAYERTPTSHRELFELAVLRLLDLKADLEDGDSSVARILAAVKEEVEVRKFIGNWCRNQARGRYTFPQEEELADAKRPDLRWQGNGFDGPVPTELKLADNWTGPKLFERLEAQLVGDYLRDSRSSRGIFLLVYRGEQQQWQLPGDRTLVDFEGLVASLQAFWENISEQYCGVEEINVIGIDLTKRYKARLAH